MRITQEAKDYAKAAPAATPEQAFQAGLNHAKAKARELEKLAARSVAVPKPEATDGAS